MATITREFQLYTNAGSAIPPVIHVNQYDRDEIWLFKLYEPSGQQFIPTDAAIVGIKADGNIIANAGTVAGGIVRITETEQMTAAPGKAVFEILFDGDTHGTANFIVMVEPSPTDDGVASESDLSLFQQAIDSISPAAINAAVSAWMSAQLTPSEWVIDNSLTVANAAADAKKAGDLIRQNTSDIGDLTDLVTEDQSSLVSAINETRTDLYNWFNSDIETLKSIHDGSAPDADIYEIQRLEFTAADDADITGLKVVSRKEGTSVDTSKFFVDGNELIEYVIGDPSDLDGTVVEEISDLKNALPFSDVTAESEMTDTSLMYRMDGYIYYYDNVSNAWKRVGSGGGSGTGSNVLPKMYLTGDTTGMSKDTAVTLQYIYVDENDKYQRTGWLKCKWQGQSSLTYPKKNFNFTFYHDALVARKDKIEFMDGCKESKWTAKANYIDHSQARNIVSARLWSEMVKSRHTAPPALLKDSPRYGAIDGYPFVIYINGNYQGLYTLNIKKEDFTFGMDEDDPLHCAICGDINNNGDNTKSLATEFRSASTDGWVVEVPSAFTTDTSAGLIALINFVMSSTDADFKANLNTYLDVESAIDYFIFVYFIGAFDNLARNLILLTYDGGTKWYCSAYDLDSTWGANAQGNLTFPSNGAFQANYAETNSLLWQRLAENFGDEIYARYQELRSTALSLDYVNREFTNFIGSIPDDDYIADVNKWTGIPNKTSNGLDFILNFALERAAYVDVEMAKLATPTAIESVTLSPSSLTFERTTVRTLNSQYFNSPFVNPSDFQQYYYLRNYTTPTLGSATTDWCTPIVSGYEAGAMVINPNAVSVRAGCTYNSNDEVVVNSGYRSSANAILPLWEGKSITDINASKCALQINTTSADNGVMVVNPKWITLDESLIPSGTGDVRTGPIIEAQAGAIVLLRFVTSDPTTESYYSAVCTYASASQSAASPTATLSDAVNKVKVVNVTGDTTAYIGFKLNRAVINDGGHLDYVVIPSANDMYTESVTPWEAQTVTASFTPSDATIDSFTWAVADNTVATISANGRTATVNAVSNGSTTITCTATDTGGLSASATANVTVQTS